MAEELDTMIMAIGNFDDDDGVELSPEERDRAIRASFADGMKAYRISSFGVAVEKPQGGRIAYDPYLASRDSWLPSGGTLGDAEDRRKLSDHATWRKLITAQMEEHGDTWDEVVRIAMDDGEMDREFDDGYGGYYDEQRWMLWTVSRVYFPLNFDGSTWVGSVPRDPCDERSKPTGCA